MTVLLHPGMVHSSPLDHPVIDVDGDDMTMSIKPVLREPDPFSPNPMGQSDSVSSAACNCCVSCPGLKAPPLGGSPMRMPRPVQTRA